MFDILKSLSYVFSSSPKAYFNLNDISALEPKKTDASDTKKHKPVCLNSGLVEKMPFIIHGSLAVTFAAAMLSVFGKK